MSWLVHMEMDAEIARREGICDSYAWHKRLWECFPGMPDKKRTEIGLLYRVDTLDGAFRIWLLGREKPVRPPWCAPSDFKINEIAPSFFSKRRYAFDLKANPVKTIVQRGPNGETLYRPTGKRQSGKRVPIVKLDELRDWLMKKGEVRCRDQVTGQDIPGGFRIVEDSPLEIRPMVENYFRKRDKAKGKDQAAFHGGVQFRGTLEVTNHERFVETYYSGIGSAKGFGFGLLLLAPVNL